VVEVDDDDAVVEDSASDSDSDYEESSSDSDSDYETPHVQIINLSKLFRIIDKQEGEELTPEMKEFVQLLKNQSKKKSDVHHFAQLSDEEKKASLYELRELTQGADLQYRPLIFRLLLSKISPSVKKAIWTKLENTKKDDSGKFSAWFEGILNIPFGKYSQREFPSTKRKIRSFLDNARATLDEEVYGHDCAKGKIMQYLGQIIRQKSNSVGMVLGIEGPMGVGKTTLIEKGVSKILGRPFSCISLGGASDNSTLKGHSFTYEGAVWGQIADILMRAGCMDPIIYLDELDKISATPKGQEIEQLLIHLIDPCQNSHFQDAYFGNIDIDLSRVTFIFSYNDCRSINPILRDRIFQINSRGFTTAQKIEIVHRHLIPKVCLEVGINGELFDFPNETIRFIIEHYTYEGGVRRVKEHLFDIIREINLEDLQGKIGIPFKRRRINGGKKSRVYEITTVHVRDLYLKHRQPIIKERIHLYPMVGRVNGLYATQNDVGGIIPIETHWLPSDTTMGMSLTGNLGKVMQESATVSRTLAWNTITEEARQRWCKQWKKAKQCIHVHCPDGAIQKEGPSAGTALTVAIISLMTENPIRNTVGITGEINLSGNVLPIGGLREKMYGAKKAGCKIVLFPKENMPNFSKIQEECPDLFEEDFQAYPISRIEDTFPFVFEKMAHISSEEKSTRAKSNRGKKR
jgi:ATP-dependent Lon protease